MLKPEISQKLTTHARKSLEKAGEIARQDSSKIIKPEHLLFAIYLKKGSLGNNLLKKMNVKKTSFKHIVFQQSVADAKKTKLKPEFSMELKSIITRAYYLASSFNYPYVGTEHFVYALMESSDRNIQKIFYQPTDAGNSHDQIDDIIKAGTPGNDPFSSLSKLFDLPDVFPTKNSRPVSSDGTLYLNQFCLNLNEEVKKSGHIIIGREKEMDRIISILGRKNKNNPTLIGEPGVGKTAIAEGLAQKINSRETPSYLLNKKIMGLDMALLVAGTSFRGEFEERLKEIIREASRNKNIILFIDEIHTIIGAGNTGGSLDAANILKPALSRGDIQCIGATTLGEYKKYIEKDPALERRFQPVKISESSPEETKKIIRGIKSHYEKFHDIVISPEAIKQAVDLSTRYIQDRFLPDKALDVLDEAASRARRSNKASQVEKEIKKLEMELEKISREKKDLVGVENYEKAMLLKKRESELKDKIKFYEKKQQREKQHPTVITGRDIAQAVSETTGLPLEKLSSSKTSQLKNLRRKLSRQIIGQNETLNKITGAVSRSQSGISNPDRPLGSFLFLGPTGVGKTLTSKILAQELFENPQSLARVDMSEFAERHSVAQLIGSPAGYVGYGEGGKLTEKIRRQPYSLVLFDEIEKAHPDVFNILLQILEDGILTDAEGRQVNFKNTFIILTSNLGTAEFTSAGRIGFASDHGQKNLSPQFNAIKNKVLDKLKKQIKPELLNRLDDIIVFNALGKGEIKKIVRLEIKNLKKRLAQQKLKLEYTAKVTDLLAQKSLDFSHGARNIRKNIRELAENKIATALIENKIKNGKIKLDVKNGKIIVK